MEFKLTLIVFINIYFNLAKCNTETQNHGMCANAECSEVISEGRAAMNYVPPESNVVFLKIGENVKIFVKEYGPNKQLGIEASSGKRRYVGTTIVTETRVIVTNLVPGNVNFLHKEALSVNDVPSSEKTTTSPEKGITNPSRTESDSAEDSLDNNNFNKSENILDNSDNSPESVINTPERSEISEETTDSKEKNISDVGRTPDSSERTKDTTEMTGGLRESPEGSAKRTDDLIEKADVLTEKDDDSSIKTEVSTEKDNSSTIRTEDSEGAENSTDQTEDSTENPTNTFSPSHQITPTSTEVSNQKHTDTPPFSEKHNTHGDTPLASSFSSSSNNIMETHTTVTPSIIADVNNHTEKVISEALNVLGISRGLLSDDQLQTLSQVAQHDSDIPELAAYLKDMAILDPTADGEAVSPDSTQSSSHTHSSESDSGISTNKSESSESDEDNTGDFNGGYGEGETKDEESLPEESEEGNENDDIIYEEENNIAKKLFVDDDDNDEQKPNYRPSENENFENSTSTPDEDTPSVDDSPISDIAENVTEIPVDLRTELPHQDESNLYTTNPHTQRSILQDEDSVNAIGSDVGESSGVDKIDENSNLQDGVTSPSDDISQSASNSDDETTEEVEPESSQESTSVFSIFFMYDLCMNCINAIRAVLDMIISWIPEPLYTYLESSGISTRATVFTAIAAFPCAFLFAAVFYLKESSKEKDLMNQLRAREHDLYVTTTERNILKDETETLKEQLITATECFEIERDRTLEIQEQLENLEILNKDANSEHITNMDEIELLQNEKERNLMKIKQLTVTLQHTITEHEELKTQYKDSQDSLEGMTEENDRLKEDIESLKSEKEYLESVARDKEKRYQTKIGKLEESCSQLLRDVEVWNTRVNELNDQLYKEVSLKDELGNIVQSKDAEIENLKTVISNMEMLQSMKVSGADNETSVEDKIQALMDISSVQNELKTCQVLQESLTERLQQEREKVLQMEVQSLEMKSDVEKMRVSYNQALQDKAEAQTKLDVLTKYFKDKEVQLQKELGVQEAVRQRKEEDATHAERRVVLIENENESYKYQVASLKQEIEETERNLKNQISIQEKKAHENWLAARAAERKVEESKQEASQLRQRLTLLEREQENLLNNSSQVDISRTGNQRIAESHDSFGSHEGSISSEYVSRHLPPPPPMLGELPMAMRPPPLLPPGSMMPPPPFLPPFDPMLPPHLPPPPHRPPHWRMIPDKHYDLDRRHTPSDFSGGRPHSPPYREQRSVSPVDGSSRSRESSPLPNFHNLPPHMPRHMDFHPPAPIPRFPPPPRGLKGPPPPRTNNRPLTDNTSSHSEDYRRFHRSDRDADV